MLIQFQVYSKVNQSTYNHSFRFFSCIGHYRVLSRVPEVLLVIYFLYSRMYLSVSISQFIPPCPLPPRNHKFVFYICNSVLQIGSFVP